MEGLLYLGPDIFQLWESKECLTFQLKDHNIFKLDFYRSKILTLNYRILQPQRICIVSCLRELTQVSCHSDKHSLWLQLQVGLLSLPYRVKLSSLFWAFNIPYPLPFFSIRLLVPCDQTRRRCDLSENHDALCYRLFHLSVYFCSVTT